MTKPFDIIVAADAKGNIGNAGGLPWPKLKADTEHFRLVTSACDEIVGGGQNVVIMGRKTWESIPERSRPLSDRLNVIVSKSLSVDEMPPMPEAIVLSETLQSALNATGAWYGNRFVIGGAQLYCEALAHPDLRYVYMTRVGKIFSADTTVDELAIGEYGNFDVMFTEDAWWRLKTHVEHEIAYRIERWFRTSPHT